MPFVGDVDGDGLEDATYVGRSDLAVYLSTGEAGLLRQGTTAIGGFLPGVRVAHPDEGAAVPRLTDLGGDSRLDLVYLGATTISSYLFTGR